LGGTLTLRLAEPESPSARATARGRQLSQSRRQRRTLDVAFRIAFRQAGRRSKHVEETPNAMKALEPQHNTAK